MSKLFPCLWFDRNAEEAARFYVDLFPDAEILQLTRSPMDYPAGQTGDVLTVEFSLLGRQFQALNGGAEVTFNQAVSLSIACETQDEINHYWSALSAHPEAEQCGWVKDRFGLYWQIVPTIMPKLLADPDREKARRVMAIMMQMKKLDIAGLERAAAG